MKQLYDCQETHADKLIKGLREHGAVLDASQTGCGKTVVACEIARRIKPPKTLVICPKAVIPVWERELKERNIQNAHVINYEKIRTGNHGFGKWKGKTIWQWTDLPEDSLIIWDECQKLQSPKSKNCRMALASAPYQNLLLSATAAEDPIDMKALGYLLGLHHIKDFWNWCKNNGCTKNPFGGLQFRKSTSDRYMTQLHDAIFRDSPPRGSRLTMTQLMDHFTETMICADPVDFGDDGKIAKIYADMEKELESLQEDCADDEDINPQARALVAQLRARQAVELLKVPLMVEIINDAVEAGESVAVFVNFDRTLDALAQRLDTKCQIRGGQNPTERQTWIDKFQHNEDHVILCNIQAGGVGVSLHDISGERPRFSVISPGFDAKELVQVLGRVHRAGGKTPSRQKILIANNTIEEKIEKAIKEKMKNMDIFNGPDLTPEKDDEIVEKLHKMTENNPLPTAHAEYNPSSLKCWELCPSYKNREEQENTELADRGTRIHDALEKNTIRNLESQEERDIAQACEDFVLGNHGKRIKEGFVLQKEIREVRVNIELPYGNSTFGTCDRLLLYTGHEADAYDYKSGWLAVEDAETNPQGHAYTLGIFQKYPDLKKIRFYFIIPNRQTVSYHVFTRDDMDWLSNRLSLIIRRAKELGGKEFNPHPHLCEYCGRSATCKANIERSLAIMQREKDNKLTLPEETDPDKMTPEDWSKILNILPAQEKFIKAVRKYTLNKHLNDGMEFPGYALHRRSTPRGVISVAGAWQALKDRMSIEDFMAACSSLSIADLEKIFAEDAPHGKKAKAKQELEDILRDAGELKDVSSVSYLKAVPENKKAN